jgi:hydrogenase maturation protease
MRPSKNQHCGKIIVFGVGNSYRCDDAAGLIVARQLKNKHLENVTIIEKDNDGPLLMAEWSDRDKVIIADAVSSRSVAGSVFRFDLLKQQIPPEKFRFSTHNMSLPDTIQLAKQLNNLPAELRLFAIEGKIFDHGMLITPEVTESLELVVNQIIGLCNKWLE